MFIVTGIGLVVLAAIVSCAVSSALDIDYGGVVYDCYKETMVFKPGRYDVMLEMMLRS